MSAPKPAMSNKPAPAMEQGSPMKARQPRPASGSGAKPCSACNQLIAAGEPGFIALGKPFHPNCFLCAGCGVAIRGQYFTAEGDEDKAYHEKCLEELETKNADRKCGGCGELISVREGAFTADGKFYHMACFRCAHCSNDLGNQYFAFRGKLYHSGCLDIVEARLKGTAQ
eukprot:RCo002687